MSQNKNPSPQTPTSTIIVLSDDSSSDDEGDLTLTTTEEEHRGTIPGSNEATAMALAGQQAVVNPVVERAKPQKVKKNTSQMSTGHASMQTESQQAAKKQ